MENTLYKKIVQKKINPKYVVEVGVYNAESSNVYNFIINGVETLLVEPDPACINDIENHFKKLKNVKLCKKAIYDYCGELKLVKRGASTFVSDLIKTPAKINDGYKYDDKDTFVVECITFDKIDNRMIDVISIDIEGGEWYVLKNLLSRPSIISIETHGDAYKNNFLKEINSWAKKNFYEVYYKTKTDTVFYKKGIFNLTLLDKIKVVIVNIYLEYVYLGEKLIRVIKLKK